MSDDGGKRLDALLLTTADLADAARQAVAQDYAVMPAGGLTSAIGSFLYDRAALNPRFRDVVAIRPKGTMTPEQVDPATPIDQILSHQIAIDRNRHTVTAGAGITFAQVNRVLEEEVGPNARVLVDLTSVGSALVGGVIATGGMGPMRVRPSMTCEAVCITDGGPQPIILEGREAITAFEGMQGWTGMTTAVRMRYFDVPMLEFGLVLPIQSTDIDAMADLLNYLHSWSAIEPPATGNHLAAQHPENTILNGIELVSRDSLEQFIAQAADPARSKAQGLLQSCEYAGADMLACLTGWSDVSVDEVLGILLDEETETIGGVQIDFGVGFSSGSEMESFRAIREGAPDLARTYARVVQPGKLRPWTTSTDINVAVPRDISAIACVLSAYDDYRREIREVRKAMEGRVEVTLAAYGHLNPMGIDPHHRVTLIAPEGSEAALEEAIEMVKKAKKELIRAIVATAEAHDYTITGGEKGMPSVVEIARASGGVDKAPANLRRMLERARAEIAKAPENFTFRAPLELKAS
ncbi:FAD-binding protein [Telmatospirillum sp. J64-1]|uniref:FAD-binding protein n=1 Tax=Telmatospirillum sp. J64-1 TaxID=2502183 RepID=UPI0021033934|nr:FAD-binding protein [Telmatospirillum sp. J64-1]